MSHDTHLQPKLAHVQIGEHYWTLAKVSVGTLFELQPVLLPLVKALGRVFSQADSDVDVKKVTTSDPSRGFTQVEEEYGATPPERIEALARQRDEALGALVSDLLSKGSREAIARLVVDCVRASDAPGFRPEDWGKARARKPDCFSVIEGIELDLAVPLAVEVVKANAEVLLPFVRDLTPSGAKGRILNLGAAPAGGAAGPQK